MFEVVCFFSVACQLVRIRLVFFMCLVPVVIFVCVLVFHGPQAVFLFGDFFLVGSLCFYCFWVGFCFVVVVLLFS